MTHQGHFPPDTTELAAKVADLDTKVAVLQTQTETLAKLSQVNSERYHNIQNSLNHLSMRLELLSAQPKCPDPGACVRVANEQAADRIKSEKFQSETKQRLDALEALRSRFNGALWAFGVSGTVIGALMTLLWKAVNP